MAFDDADSDETWDDWCEDASEVEPVHLLWCKVSRDAECVASSTEEALAQSAHVGFDIKAFRSTHSTSPALSHLLA